MQKVKENKILIVTEKAHPCKQELRKVGTDVLFCAPNLKLGKKRGRGISNSTMSNVCVSPRPGFVEKEATGTGLDPLGQNGREAVEGGVDADPEVDEEIEEIYGLQQPIKRGNSIVVGHRGYSAEYPENTCLAFRKALEAGAAVVECDVQMCKTGEVIIMHDNTVDRTTNGSGKIPHMTLDEIKSLDAGIKKGDKFRGEQVPLLSEALEIFTGRDDDAKFLIELKFLITWAGPTPYNGLAEAVVEIVKDAGAENKVIVHSFIDTYLFTIKQLAPEIECHLLCFPWRWTSQLLQIDYVDGFSPNVHYVSPTFVKRVHESGRKVFCWTVNDSDHMRYCARIGVDGIISDRVDDVREVLAEELTREITQELINWRPAKSWKLFLGNYLVLWPISWFSGFYAYFLKPKRSLPTVVL